MPNYSHNFILAATMHLEDRILSLFLYRLLLVHGETFLSTYPNLTFPLNFSFDFTFVIQQLNRKPRQKHGQTNESKDLCGFLNNGVNEIPILTFLLKKKKINFLTWYVFK